MVTAPSGKTRSTTIPSSDSELDDTARRFIISIILPSASSIQSCSKWARAEHQRSRQMTSVLCPTCQSDGWDFDTWIVIFPIVEAYVFDSGSGRITAIGTDAAPRPNIKSAECYPLGHGASSAIMTVLEERLQKAVGRFGGFGTSQRSYDVRFAGYDTLFDVVCRTCNGSTWRVGLPNTYMWLFNSRVGTLQFGMSSSLEPDLELLYARCVECDRSANDDEFARLKDSFIDAYTRSYGIKRSNSHS
jgi:hypothetical protein